MFAKPRRHVQSRCFTCVTRVARPKQCARKKRCDGTELLGLECRALCVHVQLGHRISPANFTNPMASVKKTSPCTSSVQFGAFQLHVILLAALAFPIKLSLSKSIPPGSAHGRLVGLDFISFSGT